MNKRLQKILNVTNTWKRVTKRHPPRVVLWKSESFKASSFQRKDMDIGDGVYVCMWIRSPVKEYECIEVQMHRNDVMWLSQQMQQAWRETLAEKEDDE